jgi:hypothetical protein
MPLRCLGRNPNLRPLGGTSLAIAIRGGGCEGARGRDRTLRLPVIRLRPRTFARCAAVQRLQVCPCVIRRYFCIAYRSTRRSALGPLDLFIPLRPSSRSTRHSSGLSRSSKSLAASGNGSSPMSRERCFGLFGRVIMRPPVERLFIPKLSTKSEVCPSIYQTKKSTA